MRQYRLDNKEKTRSYGREYYERNKERIKERGIRRYQEDRVRILNVCRKHHQDIKKEVLTFYSNSKEPKCVCCGEDRLPCLSIDHIEGDGALQRKSLGASAGAHLYRWLRKQGYPEGYQTLCMNCQYIKKFKNKEFANVGVSSSTSR